MPNANPKNTPAIEPDASGHQLLRVDDDRRERGREDQPDDDRQHRRPEQIRVRQQQRKRQDAQNGYPDHYLRPIRSPIGPPRMVPAATAARKMNNWSCARPNRQVKLLIR